MTSVSTRFTSEVLSSVIFIQPTAERKKAEERDRGQWGLTRGWDSPATVWLSRRRSPLPSRRRLAGDDTTEDGKSLPLKF